MGEVRVPASMHRVELQQMRVHLRIADSIVDPGDLRTACEQWLQGKFANTAKAIQGIDSHVAGPSFCDWPRSSTAFCRDIRSSDAMGRLVKPVIRLRNAP